MLPHAKNLIPVQRLCTISRIIQLAIQMQLNYSSNSTERQQMGPCGLYYTYGVFGSILFTSVELILSLQLLYIKNTIAAVSTQLMVVNTGNVTVEPWRFRPTGLKNSCRSTRGELRRLASLGNILSFPSTPRAPLQRQSQVGVQN